MKAQTGKDRLAVQIEEAERLREEDYTAESWIVFEKALKEAKAVMADEAASNEAAEMCIRDRVQIKDVSACNVAIQAAGDTITVFVDGQEVHNYKDPQPQLEGRIMLGVGLPGAS